MSKLGAISLVLLVSVAVQAAMAQNSPESSLGSGYMLAYPMDESGMVAAESSPAIVQVASAADALEALASETPKKDPTVETPMAMGASVAPSAGAEIAPTVIAEVVPVSSTMVVPTTSTTSTTQKPTTTKAPYKAPSEADRKRKIEEMRKILGLPTAGSKPKFAPPEKPKSFFPSLLLKAALPRLQDSPLAEFIPLPLSLISRRSDSSDGNKRAVLSNIFQAASAFMRRAIMEEDNESQSLRARRNGKSKDSEDDLMILMDDNNKANNNSNSDNSDEDDEDDLPFLNLQRQMGGGGGPFRMSPFGGGRPASPFHPFRQGGPPSMMPFGFPNRHPQLGAMMGGPPRRMMHPFMMPPQFMPHSRPFMRMPMHHPNQYPHPHRAMMMMPNGFHQGGPPPMMGPFPFHQSPHHHPSMSSHHAPIFAAHPQSRSMSPHPHQMMMPHSGPHQPQIMLMPHSAPHPHQMMMPPHHPQPQLILVPHPHPAMNFNRAMMSGLFDHNSASSLSHPQQVPSPIQPVLVMLHPVPVPVQQQHPMMLQQQQQMQQMHQQRRPDYQTVPYSVPVQVEDDSEDREADDDDEQQQQQDGGDSNRYVMFLDGNSLGGARSMVAQQLQKQMQPQMHYQQQQRYHQNSQPQMLSPLRKMQIIREIIMARQAMIPRPSALLMAAHQQRQQMSPQGVFPFHPPVPRLVPKMVAELSQRKAERLMASSMLRPIFLQAAAAGL